MDRIGSNSQFNPSQLYQQNQVKRTPADAQEEIARANNLSRRAVEATAETKGYSSLFQEDELTRLHSNLEEVAALAERALKRIQS